MLYSDRTGTYSDNTTCPRCGAAIKLNDVRIITKSGGPYPKCPQCETPLCVSVAYRRSVMVATLAFAWLMPYLIGLGAYIVVAWVPFFVVAIVLTNLVIIVIPPRLEDANLPKPRSVLRRNVEVFTWICALVAYVLLVSAGVARMNRIKGTFAEHLSVPLSWFDPVFRVGSKSQSLWTLGIFVTNILVCATLAFPFVVFLRSVVLRAHRRALTLLDINARERKHEDDDD
jgi:hypothetical protein